VLNILESLVDKTHTYCHVLEYIKRIYGRRDPSTTSSLRDAKLLIPCDDK